MNLLCPVCYNRKKVNHWAKTRGKIIPLKLKNHFLILNISINALPYLALGEKKNLRMGVFAPFSHIRSVF